MDNKLFFAISVGFCHHCCQIFQMQAMECQMRKKNHVRILLKDGKSFEGYVKNFSKKSRRLVLKNVTQIPQKIVIEGLRYFDENEVRQIIVLDSFTTSVSGVTDNILLTEKENDAPKHISLKISHQEYNKIFEMQRNFCFIDNTNQNFYSALATLEKSKVIGLCAADTTKGRMKRASVLAIASENDIFLFDLEKLGDKVFDKGLRNILQSPLNNVVVHNCSLLSDCLYHKHKTYLGNVSDVDAEDLVVTFQEEGYFRENPQSLGHLVESYLGISEKILNEFYSPIFWEQRPLELASQKYLAIQVSFLIPLHREIEKLYLKHLSNISKLYNHYVRNLDLMGLISEGSKSAFRKKLIHLLKCNKENE